MNKKNGFVYLIGAGPGDPGLITVKGLECLRRADVVVYDYLANPVLLNAARPDARKIYVGKSGGNHTMSQDEINHLLVKEGAAGNRVARLKGGDPFLFGRGGEEAEALVEAGIPFDVVPGVTSAIAAPAYAGIPVTHRDFTSTFAVITGHEDPSKDDTSIDWSKLATGIGTLVFLMGIGNLPVIADRLIRNGRSSQTPVALVRYGTRPDQFTISGTLADIVERAQESGIKPPAVIVVGEVVGLREKLRWFDNRPLFGKRVLVTRSREQASSLAALLTGSGAESVEFPAIRVVPPEDFVDLDRAISAMPTYDWIIFTSANGVSAVMDRLVELGKDVRALGPAKLAAIGPATADSLRAYGLRVDYVPEQFVAEAVVAGLTAEGVSGQRILIPRAADAREVLPHSLREAGAVVDEVGAYRTIADTEAAADVRKLLEKGGIDVITFTSSSTVRNFLERSGLQNSLEKLDGVTIACIGPITARTAEEYGLKVDVLAQEYTIPGLVQALSDYFAQLEMAKKDLEAIQ
jgi:uroporphyrinogen III methyltransferase / synthase